MEPVTNKDSSDAKKRAVFAISSGFPYFPNGNVLRNLSSLKPETFFVLSSNIGVWICVGTMQFTLILNKPYSAAMDLVIETMAPFEAVYASHPGTPRTAALEAVLITEPPPLFIISGIAYLQQR
jgi:hypothetical protein